jgi:type I restriction enzyme R subunit
VRALCEPVKAPRDQAAYFHYFCSTVAGDAAQLKANEPRRLDLYKLVGALLRAFAAVANDMDEAGYTSTESKAIRDEVTFFEHLRAAVKLHSGDAVDLKQYEPHMRHLIDTYIRADESRIITDFGDLTLLQLVARNPDDVTGALPAEVGKTEESVAETIENNVRRKIVDETPINPKYYERMSSLLDALIEERRQGAVKYREYLKKLQELVQKVLDGGASANYPAGIASAGLRALYDNLDRDQVLACKVEAAVMSARQDEWRSNVMKTRRVRLAILEALGGDEAAADRILGIVKAQQNEF